MFSTASRLLIVHLKFSKSRGQTVIFAVSEV